MLDKARSVGSKETLTTIIRERKLDIAALYYLLFMLPTFCDKEL